MTKRQTIEIIVLAVLCLASLRTWFWKGTGFSPLKKLGLVLAVVVFIAVALLIRSGH